MDEGEPFEGRVVDRYVVRPTGDGGLQPGVDLSSNAAVAYAMDEGTPLDALR